MQRNLLICLFIFGLGLTSCSADPESLPQNSADAGVDQAPSDVELDVEADVVEAADSQPDQGADAAIDIGPLEPRTVYEPGPYNVGHRRWDITYVADVEGERKIKLSVWYPTRDVEGGPGIYVLTYQRMQVFNNASVGIDQPAPLMVFSHGNASVGEQSYFMTEFFASHGWIVVAPFHTGNTIFDTEGAINLESGAVRPQDITATIDAMQGLDPSDPLAGLVSDDIVLSGHSFGAFTTLASTGAEFAVDHVVELCAEPDPPSECDMLAREGVEDLMRAGFLDDRIDAAIPQAPGGFFVFQDGLAAIDIPTLLMTGAMDNTLPPDEEGEPIWAAMQGPHMRLNVTRAGHFTFSNMCELIPIGQVVDDGCSDEFIPIEQAFEMINAYSLAFARYVLFDDQTDVDLLSGTDMRYGAEAALDFKDGSPLKP